MDTLSLHVAVSGLTSTQRFLKTSADKHLFNNKTWQEFIGRKNDRQPLDRKPNTEALVMVRQKYFMFFNQCYSCIIPMFNALILFKEFNSCK